MAKIGAQRRPPGPPSIFIGDAVTKRIRISRKNFPPPARHFSCLAPAFFANVPSWGISTSSKPLWMAAPQGDVHVKISCPQCFRISRCRRHRCPFPRRNGAVASSKTSLCHSVASSIKSTKSISLLRTGHWPFPHQPLVARQWCLRPVRMSAPRFPAKVSLPLQIKLPVPAQRSCSSAGSTSCGKSTTLAAMLEHINLKKPPKTRHHPRRPHHDCFVSNQSHHRTTRSRPRLSPLIPAALKSRPPPGRTLSQSAKCAKHSATAAMSAADTGHNPVTPSTPPTPPSPSPRILDFFRAGRHQTKSAAFSPVAFRASSGDGQQRQRLAAPALEIMINTPTVR